MYEAQAARKIAEETRKANETHKAEEARKAAEEAARKADEARQAEVAEAARKVAEAAARQSAEAAAKGKLIGAIDSIIAAFEKYKANYKAQSFAYRFRLACVNIVNVVKNLFSFWGNSLDSLSDSANHDAKPDLGPRMVCVSATVEQYQQLKSIVAFHDVASTEVSSKVTAIQGDTTLKGFTPRMFGNKEASLRATVAAAEKSLVDVLPQAASQA